LQSPWWKRVLFLERRTSELMTVVTVRRCVVVMPSRETDNKVKNDHRRFPFRFNAISGFVTTE
jgi:hypothetical protein